MALIKILLLVKRKRVCIINKLINNVKSNVSFFPFFQLFVHFVLYIIY